MYAEVESFRRPALQLMKVHFLLFQNLCPFNWMSFNIVPQFLLQMHILLIPANSTLTSNLCFSKGSLN